MPNQQPPAQPDQPITTADLGTRFKFFDYKDMPARQLSPTRLPEVYIPGKGWHLVPDVFDFLHSYIPSDEETVKGMIMRLEEGRKAAQGQQQGQQPAQPPAPAP